MLNSTVWLNNGPKTHRLAQLEIFFIFFVTRKRKRERDGEQRRDGEHNRETIGRWESLLPSIQCHFQSSFSPQGRPPRPSLPRRCPLLRSLSLSQVFCLVSRKLFYYSIYEWFTLICLNFLSILKPYFYVLLCVFLVLKLKILVEFFFFNSFYSQRLNVA